jgi:hypothetical protein
MNPVMFCSSTSEYSEANFEMTLGEDDVTYSVDEATFERTYPLQKRF